MTAYKDTLNDFIKRTRCNLKIIQNHASKGEDAYEITQLINSLLGLVVLPKEDLLCKIPNHSFEDLRGKGWPESFLKSSTREKLDDDLKSLITCLRNAVTHFHWEVMESQDQISGLRVWDQTNRNTGSKHWEISLTICELKVVVDKFGDVINGIDNE